MKKLIFAILTALLALFLYRSYFSAQPAPSEDSQLEPAMPSLLTPAAQNAAVFITSPEDGATVNSPLTVTFGVRDMAIVKAGDTTEFSGHHHLLINLDELPDMSMPLPASDQLIHFGGGQTETTIELPPGQHTLRLLLGNFAHVPHTTPVISEEITITVTQ